MDTAFTHLLTMLGDIADPRRAEGKLYGLPHVDCREPPALQPRQAALSEQGISALLI